MSAWAWRTRCSWSPSSTGEPRQSPRQRPSMAWSGSATSPGAWSGSITGRRPPSTGPSSPPSKRSRTQAFRTPSSGRPTSPTRCPATSRAESSSCSAASARCCTRCAPRTSPPRSPCAFATPAAASRDFYIHGPQRLTLRKALGIYRQIVVPDRRLITVPLPVMSAIDPLFMGGKLALSLQIMGLLARLGEHGGRQRAAVAACRAPEARPRRPPPARRLLLSRIHPVIIGRRRRLYCLRLVCRRACRRSRPGSARCRCAAEGPA